MTFADITLLLVEDNNDAREITGLMIARKFPMITLHSAENGRIGVELFEKHISNIIITDIKMPVMNGIQMASEIRAHNSDVKFIFLTAFNDNQHLEKVSTIGVCYYMTKPLNFNKLFSAIEDCIAEIRVKQNLPPCS